MKKKIIILSVAIFLFGIAPGVVSAQQIIARLTTTGNHTAVGGTSAVTGATILSGSTIETSAAKSSAVVSLGKLGRVELLPSTKIELVFDARGISIMLHTGGVKVATEKDVTATIVQKGTGN